MQNDLSDILSTLLAARSSAVLGTLVRVQGTSDRKPGIRRILESGDTPIGVEGIGRAENDLMACRAAVLFEGHPAIVKCELGADLDRLWGTGLGCEGTAEILLEPMFPGRIPPWVHFTAQLLGQRKRCALATILEVRGDISYQLGEVFALDEHSHGLLPIDRELSVGLHHAAQRCFEERVPHWDRFPLTGGEVEFLVEPIATLGNT